VRRALVLTLLAALWTAAPASAHSVMKVEGGTIHYTANDDVSLNDLTVDIVGDDVRFRDRGADGGITPASECSPGETDTNGYVVEVTCPRNGISAIRIDVGEAQDKVTAQVPLKVLVIGGRGSDTVTTGDGEDTLNGGEANDTLHGGGGRDQVVGDVGDDQLFGEDGDDVLQAALGTDVVDAGPGNDEVRVRDGVTDRGTCGDGEDRAQSDEGDRLEACETIDALGGTAPQTGGGPDAGPAPPDTAAPRLRAGGSTAQRLGRAGRLVVLATSSEPCQLVAAGYLVVGERRFVFRAARADVGVGGGGVRLTLALSRRDARSARRLLRRRRKATAVLSVVATDVAGNSSSARLPRIAVRR
jgi:hypothetical protein